MAREEWGHDGEVETGVRARRERPVATGILAAALAFRLFALLIPLIYVLAWRLPPIRRRQNPRLVLELVAGAVLATSASAAAELNATLWERRAQRLRPNTPPP